MVERSLAWPPGSWVEFWRGACCNDGKFYALRLAMDSKSKHAIDCAVLDHEFDAGGFGGLLQGCL